GSRVAIIWHSFFKNSSLKATKGPMQVCVTILFDGSLLTAEKLQQAFHQKSLCLRAHGRPLFCFCSLQKSSVFKSERRSPTSVILTRKLIWHMTSFSSLLRCYANARESTWILGLPRCKGATFPNCSRLLRGWKKTKTL